MERDSVRATDWVASFPRHFAVHPFIGTAVVESTCGCDSSFEEREKTKRTNEIEAEPGDRL